MKIFQVKSWNNNLTFLEEFASLEDAIQYCESKKYLKMRVTMYVNDKAKFCMIRNSKNGMFIYQVCD